MNSSSGASTAAMRSPSLNTASTALAIASTMSTQISFILMPSDVSRSWIGCQRCDRIFSAASSRACSSTALSIEAALIRSLAGWLVSRLEHAPRKSESFARLSASWSPPNALTMSSAASAALCQRLVIRTARARSRSSFELAFFSSRRRCCRRNCQPWSARPDASAPPCRRARARPQNVQVLERLGNQSLDRRSWHPWPPRRCADRNRSTAGRGSLFRQRDIFGQLLIAEAPGLGRPA
jgi:hypothetical protein